MADRPDLAGLVADLASAGVEDHAFDGHPTRSFADMNAEERLDDLSRKIALVWELRKSRAISDTKSPATAKVDSFRNRRSLGEQLTQNRASVNVHRTGQPPVTD